MTDPGLSDSPAEFKRRFAHTALLRPGLQNLLRNIANLDLCSK